MVGSLVLIAGVAVLIWWGYAHDPLNPKLYDLTDNYVKSQYDQLVQNTDKLKSGFNFDAAVARANALVALGKQSAAISAWQYFIQNRPNALQGYWGLAQIYTSQKKYDLVETNWLKAIEIDKQATYDQSFLQLADLYTNYLPEKRYKIVQIISQAIATNPTAANYPLILANYYDDISDFKSALTFYRKAYQLDPKGGAHLKAKIAELEQKV